MSREDGQSFKFDVFISYRHAELDSAVAGYLQRALEHYRIPREIRKKCGKENIHRVFRDEEELGVASDLFGEIEQNLKESEFLVVVCSPRILESRWCMREIETFIKYRGRENILPVLIEGEPETAFPPILLEEGEPLAADFRGKDTREVLRHARERMPRLVAPLLYCSYDELFQRHRIYKMRRLLALAGVVAAAALGFGLVTWQQSREIQRNYQAKLENQFRYLAQTSQELLNSGDRDAALLVALEALPEGSGDTTRPYVAEARIALEDALYTYSMNYRYQLRPWKQLEHKGEIGNCMDINEEENVLLTADSRIYIWDGATLENLCCWEEGLENALDAKFVGNHSVAVLTNEEIFCFDYRTGEVLWRWDYPVCDTSGYCGEPSLIWTYDAQSNQLLCANKYLRLHRESWEGETRVTEAHQLHLIDAATGESRSWAPAALYDLLEGDAYNSISLQEDCFLLSPGGKWTALAVKQGVGSEEVILALFATGEDTDRFAMTYPLRNALSNAIEEAVWLDEDHLALIHIKEGTTLLGQAGKPATWELECWNVETGECRLRYEDTCLCLNNQASVKRLVPDGDESQAVLSVVYDNVAVCLDWTTGEQYSRIEDRSAIVLNHIWSNAAELIVTADGYLFSTNATDDYVWQPVFSAYHYYIGISDIKKALWLNDSAFFFTSTGVYCYAPVVDNTYTMLEGAPYQSIFSRDSSRLLTVCNNGRAYLYDTGDLSTLWEDECCVGYNRKTAALVEDRMVACLAGNGTTVKLHPLDGGEDRRVELEGYLPALADSTEWCLQAGGEKLLVWNKGSFHCSVYSETIEEDLACPVLWLIDPDTGEVVGQWTYGELMGDFDPQMSYLYPGTPNVSASGRYVLIPFWIVGYLKEDTLWENRIEKTQLLIWDLETGETVELDRQLLDGMTRQLNLGNYFDQDGWLSPTEDRIVLYNGEKGVLQVIDLPTGELLHELAVDGISSREVSFTDDGDHLIFQDNAQRLHVYDWKKGEYTMQGVSPEGGYLKFAFYQGGEVLSTALQVNSMTSESVHIYRKTGNGVYKLETAISFCRDCDGKTVVISSDDISRLYHAYTLDDLIAKARKVLDGRELTADERRVYLID